MHDLFFEKFNEKVLLNAAEKALIAGSLTTKRLRKRQYFLQEGDICKSIAFVERGAMRSYSIDEKGSEHIVQFALEGWTISDLYSFLTGEPATYNIEAIEDTELTVLSKSAHEDLLKRLPKYETYNRLQVTGAYISMQKRLTSIANTSIEQRYLTFTQTYPSIAQRVPQRMIASYLGLTPETLSRIRRKISMRS